MNSLNFITSKKNEISISSSNSKSDIERIDELIISEIEKLTSENSSVWTSPDHNRREYVHSFFQYPAMMVPVVQKRIIDIIKKSKPDTQKVIDPFMGSATSLVACMQNGLDCYGQDINPLSILIAKARTGPYYVSKILKNLDSLFSSIDNDKSKAIESKFAGRNKWFKAKASIEISRIIRAIREESNLAIRRFYWINLAEVIRLTSNDRTSTFKLHARPLEEIEERNLSPIREFKSHIKQSIKDLELHRKLLIASNQISNGSSYKGTLKFKLQDSSKKISTTKNTKAYFDLLVTSPPYGDNKTTVTYGQHSYLPLQWIDLEDIDEKANDDFLKTTSEIDTRSLGGRIKKLTEEQLLFLYEKSETFKLTHLRLKQEVPDRADKVVVFLQDLFRVIENVFEVMKPNSYQVWTIGNRTVGGIEIPNNDILKEFAISQGAKLVTTIEREILNKRMAKRNNSSALMNTEDILIFRKIG